jgi:hypothetical protein
LTVAFELHDSRIASVLQEPGRVRVVFDPLYLLGETHGWYQSAVLELGHGSVSGALPDDEADNDLSSGQVVVGSRTFVNVVPLPLSTTEPVEITLNFSQGERLILRCQGAVLQTLGEPGERERLPEKGSGWLGGVTD